MTSGTQAREAAEAARAFARALDKHDLEMLDWRDVQAFLRRLKTVIGRADRPSTTSALWHDGTTVYFDDLVYDVAALQHYRHCYSDLLAERERIEERARSINLWKVIEP